MFAVVYTDEGPKGISAQSCSITSSWTMVFLFSSEVAAKKFISKLPVGRKNPRCEMVSDCDGDGYGELEDLR